jgi:sugar O-acyltransferase (sialic acid O-acetyltransferase NeuD family)
MMKKVVIIGAGGFGREVLDIIDACNLSQETYDPLGFVVDPEFGEPGTLINERPILGGFDWLAEHVDDTHVVCAVGASHQRYQLIERARKLNCRFISLIHPSVIRTRWISIGEGVIIAAGCILTNQIQIGNHVHINLDCTIGHDAHLKDFATLAPGVHVSGKVLLETGCYVGTGANIIEKLQIGEWSIVGAGSVVTGNIPANSTAVGIPAKVIKEREPGWHSK